MQRVMATFEPRNTAFDQGRSSVADAESNAGEAVGVRARKAARKLDLVVCQDIDGVSLGGLEGGKAP
jgi:hypothetical protein